MPKEGLSPQTHIHTISLVQYASPILFPLLQFHPGTQTEPFHQANICRDPRCTGADPAQLMLPPTPLSRIATSAP